VTYAAGPVKSTVDYIIVHNVQQQDEAKVRIFKVIPNEECVRKHKLLLIDMWFSITKRWRKKCEPRVCEGMCKLKEERTWGPRQ